MNTVLIRQQLHRLIDSLEDQKAEAMYMLLKDSFDSESRRRMLVQEEREKYLKGNAPGYSLEEVKNMALNKNQRPDEF